MTFICPNVASEFEMTSSKTQKFRDIHLEGADATKEILRNSMPHLIRIVGCISSGVAQNYSNLFWNIGGWVKCKSGWPRCDDLLKLLVVVGGEGQSGETDPGWDPVDHDTLLERTRVKVLNSRVIERLKSVANWCDVTRLRLPLLWLYYVYPTLALISVFSA